MRVRAMTLPRRVALISGCAAKYGSTSGVIGIVRAGRPSASITVPASARLSGVLEA